MGVLAVDFRGRARNWWGLLVSNRASFEGRRDGEEGQGAGVVQRVWMRVEMWERGDYWLAWKAMAVGRMDWVAYI